MAEQQLVDYIKKARDAGQADDQTRNLLYKNGWTEAEVDDAFLSLNQPEPQSQAVSQPEIKVQPQIVSQPQPQVASQPKPQYQPQSSTGAMENNMPRVRKSHMILKLLMVLIIVIVLGGAGYFVAGQYLNLPYSNLLWSLFAPNPQTVVNNMLTNMEKVTSYHTTTQVDVAATNSTNKTSIGELVLNTNSEIDITDINNPKTDGNFIINLTMPGSSSPLASVSVSLASVGGVSYIQLNNIVVPATFYAPGLDISKIQGEWFKIDQDSVKALSQVEGNQVTIPNIPQVNALATVAKLQNLIASENLISFNKQLNDEVVSGQDTYHYLLTISKDKLEDLLNKAIALGLSSSSNSQVSSTTNSSSSLIENMAQAFVKTCVDAIGDINLEVWIGKKDYMLYQDKIDQLIDSNKIEPNTNVQAEVKIDMVNSNFNKPIVVQAPANAQKIEDIVLPLLKTQKIDSDMNQIGSIAFSYSTKNFPKVNYSSLCYNGLLNGYLSTYGSQLISLNNDIVSQGAKKPVCFSGTQTYCVSTQLADGSYLCIGENNVLGETRCVSYNTVCK